MLGPLVAARQPLTAEFDFGEVLLVSQLLSIDPEGEHIVVAYCSSRNANARLLAAPQVEFHCNSGDGHHVTFQSGDGTEVIAAGEPAVRMSFPSALLLLQRRVHVRMPAPGKFTLRCIADSGGITPFDARVVDVSRGGIGAILYDARIELAPGTLLKRCLIVPPRGKAMAMDLEVRNTRTITLSDGRAAHRSGCRFAGPADETDRLLHLFVVELRDGG